MATTLTTSVFDNLVHEIETAEIKLKLFNSSVSGKEQGCEAKVLEEEINLLKQSVPEGIVGDDGDTGLHYYTAVGELEKEVAELRKLSEILPQCSSFLDETTVEMTELPDKLIRTWAAQLVTVLSSLHYREVIIRDLNPSNLLLDSNGHVKLTYQVNTPL